MDGIRRHSPVASVMLIDVPASTREPIRVLCYKDRECVYARNFSGLSQTMEPLLEDVRMLRGQKLAEHIIIDAPVLVYNEFKAMFDWHKIRTINGNWHRG